MSKPRLSDDDWWMIVLAGILLVIGLMIVGSTTGVSSVLLNLAQVMRG